MIDGFFDYQHAHETYFLSHGTKHVYKKGQYIVTPHDDSPWVYFLAEGYVNASFGSYDGTERIIGFFLPGMSFAKIGAFFQRNDGNLQYCATTTATVYRVHQDEFLGQLTKDTTFNAEYLNWLLKVQILLIERIVLLAQPTMRQRVLHWLVFMKKYYGETTIDTTCRIAVPLTQDIVGSFLHATRESVGAVLRDLQRSGIVSIEKKHITIEQTRSLEKMLG